MPAPEFIVDLTDPAQLRAILDEYLGQGVCPVPGPSPAVMSEVAVRLRLPGGGEVVRSGLVIRATPWRFLVQVSEPFRMDDLRQRVGGERLSPPTASQTLPPPVRPSGSTGPLPMPPRASGTSPTIPPGRPSGLSATLPPPERPFGSSVPPARPSGVSGTLRPPRRGPSSFDEIPPGLEVREEDLLDVRIVHDGDPAGGPMDDLAFTVESNPTRPSRPVPTLPRPSGEHRMPSAPPPGDRPESRASPLLASLSGDDAPSERPPSPTPGSGLHARPTSGSGLHARPSSGSGLHPTPRSVVPPQSSASGLHAAPGSRPPSGSGLHAAQRPAAPPSPPQDTPMSPLLAQLLGEDPPPPPSHHLPPPSHPAPPEPPPLPEEAAEPEPSRGGRPGSSPEAETTFAKLRDLPVTEKQKMARHGNRLVRHFLIRDPNKNIHIHVVQNPDLTTDEIVEYSAITGLSRDAIEFMIQNTTWMASRQVVFNLAKNPGTPTEIAIRLLPRVNPADLRVLIRPGAARAPIGAAARKLVYGEK